MSTQAEKSAVNRQTVEAMWQALAAMDWDAMKSCMHDDIFYQDVPTDDPGAHGPENTVKRLRMAFDHLSKQEQTTHHLAVDGDTVFIDHTEKWTFNTGETAEHRFVTMHEMKDGKVFRWSDFWDVNKFVSQFPGWFLEVMAKGSADEFS